jgi:hypothetical protein
MFGIALSPSTPVKVSLVVGSAALLLFGVSQVIYAYKAPNEDEDSDSGSSTDSTTDSESEN